MTKYILTGGPGVGKSTLIDKLEAIGYHTIPEAASQIITEEQTQAEKTPNRELILPWTNLTLFQRLVAERQRLNESKFYRDKPTFLDRSLIDNVAYSRLGNVTLDHNYERWIREAGYSTVFFLEPLATYENTAVRHENEEFAARISQELKRTYHEMGCDVISVPSFHSGTAPDTIEKNLEARLAVIREAIETPSWREHEAKYAIEDLATFREKFEQLGLEQFAHRNQRDTYHDLFGLLGRAGYSVRLRDEGDLARFTINGSSKRSDIADRLEIEFVIPRIIAALAQIVLPTAVTIEKTRSEYMPKCAGNTKFALDDVKSLGTYVEIEGNAAVVKSWGERLGLTNHESRSYKKLLST